MVAGLLNEEIAILKPYTRDGKYGKSSKTDYIPYINTTRARVINQKGTRSNENNEIVYIYTVTFIIRGYHQVDDYMRIKWKNNYYRILNIVPATSSNNEIQIDTELVHE